jgi:integrase
VGLCALEDERNPASRLKLPKDAKVSKRYLDHQQVHDLAEAVDARGNGYGLFVLVLSYCGLRWGCPCSRRTSCAIPARASRCRPARTSKRGKMLGHASAKETLNIYEDLFDSDLDSVAVALDEQILRTDVAETLPRAEMALRHAQGPRV